MAANVVHDAGDGGNPPVGANNDAVQPPRPNEEIVASITPALERFAPETTPTTGVVSTNERFNLLYTLFYGTLEIRQVPGGHQHIRTSFCRLTDAELEPYKGAVPELAGIQANPLGLFHVLYLLKHATVRHTRDQKRQLVATMNKADINAVLRTGLAEPNDDREQEDYLMTIFMRLLNHMVNAIKMLHQKVRLGVESYSWYKMVQKSLTKLETKVQDMQYTLCTRAEANDAAHNLVRYRAKLLETLTNFVALREATAVANCRMFLDQPLNPFNELNAFTLGGANGLIALVDNQTLYSNFIHVDDFEATEVEELQTLKTKLNDLFKDIKSYVPSDLDKAHDISKNLKPFIISTCDDYNLFQESTTKTLGTAQSLMKDIDGHRTTCQKLQSDGLIINEATVGTTQQKLQRMYAVLSDFVNEEQQKARLAEAKSKIELQELSKASANVKLTLRPLHHIRDWLGFIQSYEEIIPLHTSELVKAQVVREALKDRKDKSNCQNLSHDDIMNYLRMKYDDAELIPDLISEIVSLPRATSYQQSHDNIIQFQQMMMHLEHHNAEYRLDGATRDKLVPVLLPEKLQVDFFKSRRVKELEWKQEFNPDSASEADDSMSIISARSDERLEELRRKHFVDEITETLPIMRQLMKSTAPPSSEPKGKGKGGYPGNKGNKSYARAGHFDTSSPNCPICLTVHKDKNDVVLQSLSRCPKFKGLDVKTRNSIVKSNDYCRRCLRAKDSEGHQDNYCKWATERNHACHNHDPPSTSHHPMLCNSPPKDQQSQPKDGNSGGGGGGRGGRGGKGGGKRGGRGGRGGKGGSSSSQGHLVTTNQSSDSNQPPVVQFGTGTPTSDDHIKPRLISNTKCNKSVTYIDLKRTRGLLSCATYGTIVFRQAEIPVLVMADSGSGLGFITLSLTEQYQIPQAGVWTGSIETLQGDMHGTFPLYVVHLMDTMSQLHPAQLIGVETIGYKDKVPNAIHDDMCAEFKLDKNFVMNCSGTYDILLGVDKCLLHPDKNPHRKSTKYPEAVVMSSPLSESYFLMGAIGAPLNNGNSTTFSFYTGAKALQGDCVYDPDDIPPLAYNSLGKASNKASATKSFLGKLPSFYSTPTDEQPKHQEGEPPTWVDIVEKETEETQKKDKSIPCYMRLCKAHRKPHQSNCKSFVAYMTRKSAATIDMELTSAPPALTCQSCQLQIASCATCKYINSSMSIKEMEELALMRDSVKVTTLPDGKKSVMVSYLQKKDPMKLFCPENSNHAAAAASSIRLRKTLMKIGQLEAFDAQIKKTIDDGHAQLCNANPKTDCPSNYILLNYAMKDSKSQPVRPISNSSFCNKGQESLNSNTVTGPSWLGSGLQCLLNWRYGIYAYCADLSRFYRSVKTCDMSNALRKFYWFTDVSDESTLTTYQFIVGNYGDSAISLYTEIIVNDIIAPECKTPELANACRNNRVVDDIVSSTHSYDSVCEIKKDMLEVFSTFNFKVKHFLHTGQEELDEEDRVTSVLGLNWNIPDDTITCKTVLFPDGKRRGKQIGECLNKKNVETTCLDKETLARFSGTLFDYTGIMLGPVQAAMRVAYSKVCSLTTKWDTPAHILDPVIDSNIRNMLRTLTDLPRDINPFPRCLTLPGHTPEKLIVCSDASSDGLGYCYYLISRGPNNSVTSNICLSRPFVHKLTVCMGELDAIVRAVKMLPEFFKMLPQLTKLPKLRIIILTDSLAMAGALNPSKPQKEVRPRNACISIHRVLTEIVQLHPNFIAQMVHTEGIKNPSDSLTRLTSDPISLVNSSEYRHGQKYWTNPAWPPKEAIFLEFQHNQPVKFLKPIAEQALPATSEPSTTQCNLGATKSHDLPTLGQVYYSDLLNNCSTFEKLTGTVATILERFSKSPNSVHHGKSRNYFQEVATKMILRTHQKLYGLPKNIKLTRPWTDDDGLTRVTTRLDMEAGVILGTDTSPVIINPADKKLVELLMRQAHLCKSGHISKIHIGSRLTTANMRKLGYWLPRQSELVSKFVANCSICNRISKNPTSPELGSPRWVKMMKSNNIIWSFLSIDEIGPFQRKPYPGSRTTIRYYVLCILDIVTTAVNYELMEDKTRSSVHKALYNHVQTYGTQPVHIFCDAGTSIAPDPLSADYNKYFSSSMQVTQYLAGHQALNNIERFIQMGKRILKSALLQRERLSLPNLSYTDLRVLLNATKGVINSRPLFKDDANDIILTANHLIHPYFVVEQHSECADLLEKAEESNRSDKILQNLEFFSQNLSKLSTALQMKNQYLTGMLKTLFVSDNRKVLQSGKKTVFRKDDIVLVFKTVEYNLGVVTDPGEQHTEVLSSGYSPPRKERVHNSKLVLLFRENTEPKTTEANLTQTVATNLATTASKPKCHDGLVFHHLGQNYSVNH